MLCVIDGRVLPCEGLIIMDGTFMLYGKACYAVLWISLSAVWITKLCVMDGRF